MRKSILIALAAALAISVSLHAQPMGGMMGRGDDMHQMMIEKLKLSDQQIERLQDSKMKMERDLVQKKADLKLAKLDMQEIMRKSQVDEKAALAQVDKISAIKADIARIRMQHKLDAQKILTADQRKEFMKMHRDGMMGPRGHKRGGPMMGPMGHMGQGMGCMGPGMGMDQAQPEKENIKKK